MRRALLSSNPLLRYRQVTTAALLSSSSTLTTQTAHSSSSYATAANPAEQQREDGLRQRIQQTYKNMKLTPMQSYEYGTFQPSKFAMNNSNSNNSGGNDTNNNSSSSSFNNSGNQQQQQQQQNGGGTSAQPDFLMLGTGLALVYVTSQALSDRVNGAVLPTRDQFIKDPTLNTFTVPLWCASAEQQAYYLLFLISVEGPARESLRLEFQNLLQAQQLPPFTTFFDWLLRYGRLPVLGCGTSYDRATVVGTLTSALASGSSMQLAGLGRVMATTVAESSSPASASGSFFSSWFPVLSSSFGSANNAAPAMPGAQPNVYDMQSRIDRFMSELQKQGFAIGGGGGRPPQYGGPQYGYPTQQQMQQQPFPSSHSSSMHTQQQSAVGAGGSWGDNTSNSGFTAAQAGNAREMQLESLRDHNRVGQRVSIEDVLNSVQGGKQQ